MSSGEACRIDVEWGRGRLFDQDAAQLFQQLVKEARTMRCTSISIKEERQQRPHGEASPLLVPDDPDIAISGHPSPTVSGNVRRYKRCPPSLWT